MYKVFAISENTNSFGLKQFYAMNEKGDTIRACANYLNVPKRGDVLKSPKDGPFELFEEVGIAPDDVIKEVFKK